MSKCVLLMELSVDIDFKNRKLERIFNDDRKLKATYVDVRPDLVMKRMAVLKNSPTLTHVPTDRPLRRHQLFGNRKEQFTVDLDGSYRLFFKVNHDPVPRKENGGIDTDKVSAIRILEIADHH